MPSGFASRDAQSDPETPLDAGALSASLFSKRLADGARHSALKVVRTACGGLPRSLRVRLAGCRVGTANVPPNAACVAVQLGVVVGARVFQRLQVGEHGGVRQLVAQCRLD